MRYLLQNLTFNLDQETLTKNTVLDQFVNFPFRKVFEEFIQAWHKDPSKAIYISRFLQKSNKPDYFGSVIWAAAKKEKSFLEFICRLKYSSKLQPKIDSQSLTERKRNANFFSEHNRMIKKSEQDNENPQIKEKTQEDPEISQRIIQHDVFSQIIAQFESSEIDEMLGDDWLMETKGPQIIVEAIKKLKLNDLKEYLEKIDNQEISCGSEANNKASESEYDQNQEQTEQKSNTKNFIRSFAKAQQCILDLIVNRDINQSKARIIITKVRIAEIFKFRSESNQNIFMCLAKAKIEAILILIFKIVDKHAIEYKPEIKEMLAEEDRKGNSVREYLLSTQNRMYFEYFNSYFDTQMFSDFRFLEVSVNEASNKNFKFKNTKELETQKDSFLRFFGEFTQTNFEKLRNLYVIFKESPSIAEIEKQNLVDFRSEFVNDKEGFTKMMEHLKQQQILSLDMEYYKATNISSNSSNFLFPNTSISLISYTLQVTNPTNEGYLLIIIYNFLLSIYA